MKIPKSILYTAKLLEYTSPKLATLFATKLFATPIRHKVPKRELHMLENSIQKQINISSINKNITVYEYGNGSRNALLVHGWSGRGTQLVKIADLLVAQGFRIISFDAPAHGNSSGKTTIMTEFIACIHHLNKLYSGFNVIVGHSLGSMATLNAIKQGITVNKVVIIGSGDIIKDITDEFVRKLRMKPNISEKLTKHFESKFQIKMNDYSASVAAEQIELPVLIIHDTDDVDVPVKAAYNIASKLKNHELYITSGLGHRKILGDTHVLNKIRDFIK